MCVIFLYLLQINCVYVLHKVPDYSFETLKGHNYDLSKKILFYFQIFINSHVIVIILDKSIFNGQPKFEMSEAHNSLKCKQSI